MWILPPFNTLSEQMDPGQWKKKPDNNNEASVLVLHRSLVDFAGKDFSGYHVILWKHHSLAVIDELET